MFLLRAADRTMEVRTRRGYRGAKAGEGERQDRLLRRRSVCGSCFFLSFALDEKNSPLSPPLSLPNPRPYLSKA